MSIISMYDIQNVERLPLPHNYEELNADSKQFHDTRTGNWRYVFAKVIYDPESFIHVDNIIGMSGSSYDRKPLLLLFFSFYFSFNQK